jgi:polyvinyl alcohol dehydrogenase (cytochrome)
VKPGTVLWSAKMPGPVDGSLAVSRAAPMQSSTASGPTSVFVPVALLGSPELIALDAATGSQQWATVLDNSTDADVFGSPVPVHVDGREVVLQGVSATSGDPPSPLRGSLSELDAKTGAVIWKTYTVPPADNGGAVWSTPAVDTNAGVVYAGTGNAYTGAAAPTTDAIVKFDLRTGAILGWFQGTAGDAFSSMNPGLDFDFGASPNLMTVNGKSLVGEGQKSGTYWAVDTTTMKPVWNATLGVGSAAGGVLGSTAFDAATGRIAGPETLPGYLWSVTASSGQLEWLTPGGVDPVQWSPVSVSNGVAYSVASTGFLEAFNESNGVPLAVVPINPLPPTGSYAIGLGSGVAIADGLVIADLGSGQGSEGVVAAFTS